MPKFTFERDEFLFVKIHYIKAMISAVAEKLINKHVFRDNILIKYYKWKKIVFFIHCVILIIVIISKVR